MNFTTDEERTLLNILEKTFGDVKEELEYEISTLSTSHEYCSCNAEHIEYIENELDYLKSISGLISKVKNDFEKEM